MRLPRSGNTYNIPVTIWLRKEHPYQNPIVYVTPTQDMGIQPSRFVDRSGLVFLPYLSEWKAVSQPAKHLCTERATCRLVHFIFCPCTCVQL